MFPLEKHIILIFCPRGVKMFRPYICHRGVTWFKAVMIFPRVLWPPPHQSTLLHLQATQLSIHHQNNHTYHQLLPPCILHLRITRNQSLDIQLWPLQHLCTKSQSQVICHQKNPRCKPLLMIIFRPITFHPWVGIERVIKLQNRAIIRLWTLRRKDMQPQNHRT